MIFIQKSILFFDAERVLRDDRNAFSAMTA